MIGYINKIESMGLVDGPGIRTVIFMQGCPLRCIFCHNPETWKTSCGMTFTPQELVDKIKRYKPYYGSDGGVTFSGGEPVLQADCITECARLLKKENINICLDTSGVGSNYLELLDYLDLIILDIKGITENGYKKITGANMNGFQKFLSVCQDRNKPLWLRQVIIPGINDNYEYIQELREYIKDIKNVMRVELLPYHTMAISKYEQLKIPYSLRDVPAMDKKKCVELEQLLNNL